MIANTGTWAKGEISAASSQGLFGAIASAPSFESSHVTDAGNFVANVAASRDQSAGREI